MWIHGGGFENGSAAIPTFDGSAFARDGIVCVTINYRLGAPGFLHLPDAPANRGLLDQIAALRWVQANIAAFGGDPGRVTLGGESAGAISVACLMCVQSAEGLFSRAVMQSGAGHHALPGSTARHIAERLSERLGVEATSAALSEVPIAALLEAQRALVVEAQQNPDPGDWGQAALDMMLFEPVIDGELLPDMPVRAITGGAGHGIPLLAGWNRDELRHVTVAGGLIDTIAEATVRGAAEGYGLSPDVAIRAYQGNRGSLTPGEMFTDLLTDWMFRIPAIRLTEARPPATTWLYEFCWPSTQFDGRLGACHMLELGFVFDTLDREANRPLQGDTAPQTLADIMHGAWARFIHGNSPGWVPYDVHDRAVQEFGERSSVVYDGRAPQRTVWDGLR